MSNNDDKNYNIENNNSIKELIKESIEESMKPNQKKNSKPVLFHKKLIPLSMSLFMAIALSILFFFLLYNIKNVNISLGNFITALKPFIYGGIIAYILVPMCNKYQQWLERITMHLFKVSKKEANIIAKPLSIGLSFLTAFLIIYVLLSLILPELIVSLNMISKNLTSYYSTALDWINNTFKNNDLLKKYAKDVTDNISGSLYKFIISDLLPNTETLVTSVSSGVMNVVSVAKNLFIGIIVAIYLLNSRERFSAQSKILVHSILKEKHANKLIKEVRFTNKMFMGFISGRLVDSAIIGVLCFIGLTVMNIQYAFLISVLIGVTNIIPFFGPFIGGIPSGLLILMDDPVRFIWFVVFIIVLQQIDGNIIGPKIMGEMTNLNSFWVLFAIMVFSGLFGFIGMLIGVPVFAVIYHLSQELILKGLKRTGYEPSPEDAEISGYSEMIEELKLEDELGEFYLSGSNRKTLTQRFLSLLKKVSTRINRNTKK